MATKKSKVPINCSTVLWIGNNFYSDLSLKEGRMGKTKQSNSAGMQQCLETRFNLFNYLKKEYR